MGTFGSTATNATVASTLGIITGSIFTCPEDCTADKLSIIVDVKEATKKTKCAIYDSALNFVAETEQRTLALGLKKSEDFEFTSPPELTGSAEYWLCAWAEGPPGYVNVYYVAGATDQMLLQGVAYNDFPATLAPEDYYDRKIAILCTYTPVAAAPTVTTQAVDDITATTATGNGTITDIGGENCSKRGVCWNKTGSPTVADDKSEETDSFGAEAFDVSMTNLDPGTLYYVRAYAYNSAGYGYGSQVEFTTTQVISPSAVSVASAVQAPALSGSGAAPVTASPVATVSAVQAPALSGSGAAPITPTPLAATSLVQPPVISVSIQFITPSPVAVSSSIQAPSLSGSGVASVSPSAVSVGSSVQSPALSGSGAAPVTASPMATVSSIQAPVLEPTGAAPVSPSPVQASSAVQAPSMSGSGVATISSSPIAAASSIQTPSIATDVQFIEPSPVAAISALQTPLIVGTGVAAVSLLPVAAISVIVAPIISVAISYRYRYNVFTGKLDTSPRIKF